MINQTIPYVKDADDLSDYDDCDVFVEFRPVGTQVVGLADEHHRRERRLRRRADGRYRYVRVGLKRARRYRHADLAQDAERAALVGDRQSDQPARLQAGAHADAGTRLCRAQSQLTLAHRRTRLLQGPARATRRRHRHHQGGDYRQGRNREQDRAKP